MSSTVVPAGRLNLSRGVLPKWAPIGVPLAALALAVAIALGAGISPALLIVLAAIVSGVGMWAWARAVEGPRAATDRLVTHVVTSAFILAVIPLVSLLITVVGKGLARFDTAFFTESQRNVVGAGGGAEHAISGTLIITGIAAVISVPIGVLTAIYLVEYGRGRLARAITFFVDVMTGIPSIVSGLFAYALFVLFFGPGIRLGVMGSIALAVLMVPIVVRATEEMLRIVPNGLRESAYALGVPKWRMIMKVVIPTALAGIVSGVMLAVARVIGETAPLLVTTGVISSDNYNPFDGRMMNLAVFAFDQYKNPGVLKDAYIDRAWAAALTLIVIVMVLNLLGRLVYRRFGTELR